MNLARELAPKSYMASLNIISDLAEQVGILTDGLRRYAIHDDDCTIFRPETRQCSCKLQALLDSLAKKQPESPLCAFCEAHMPTSRDQYKIWDGRVVCASCSRKLVERGRVIKRPVRRTY